MKIEVNPQMKKFWLAMPDRWEPIHGHEIKIGEFSFSACVTKQGILVSEVTTGMYVTTFPHNFLTALMGATKEGTLDYYETFVAPSLVAAVEKHPDPKKLIELGFKQIESIGLGKMPPIEDVDDSIITEPISKTLS